MTSTQQDNWDQHWDIYAESARHNPAQAYRRKLIFGQLTLRREGEGARILDIGSGQGDFAAELRAKYPKAEILGLELSRSGVEHSRRKVPDAVFHQRNLLEAAEPLEGFEKWATHAVCSEVLEHIEQPEVMLRNIRAFLSPSARLVLTVPGGPRSAFDRHIGHRKHYTVAEFEALLRESGFAVELAAGAGFPFFNLYKTVVIARGRKLIEDVSSKSPGGMSLPARAAMSAFSLLFKLNRDRSRLGWQIVAVAQPSAAAGQTPRPTARS